ncbi:protein TOPAZ1 isoform X2 [Syngnathus scovelli]|uniref:protein TOPAZ1 isoform X2 n=1 Tax=Syngnathus scovelli TaxID=161590 RepID=UPI0021109426|nr:protein TOPAZ1 isoform X2 [Syngnathus scovelli]
MRCATTPAVRLRPKWRSCVNQHTTGSNSRNRTQYSNKKILRAQQNLSEDGGDRTFFRTNPIANPLRARGTSVELVPWQRGCITDLNPTSTSIAGSECAMRRIIKSSGCGLCGDCKITPSQIRTLIMQEQKNLAPHPEPQKATQVVKEALQATVNICDVLNSDPSCYHCGFVLPDGLKTKTVHCFKQEMRAGLQIRPRCFGLQKHGNDEHPNGTSSASVQKDEEVRGSPETCTMPDKMSELLDDGPVSFTCQRVRIFVWKKKDSCARTYITRHSRQFFVNRIMNLDNGMNDSEPTQVFPSVFFTPREPLPSFSLSGAERNGIDNGPLEETEKNNEGQGASEQLEQTMNAECSPGAAESGSSPCSFDRNDDDEVFNGEGRSSSDSDPGPSSSEPAESSTEIRASADTQPCVLDEVTAYQHDILLVNVNQDDSELFGNLPQESLLKLGPDRVLQDPKTLNTYGESQPRTQSWTPVNINLLCDSPDNEESPSRPWRPQKSTVSPKRQKIVFSEEYGTKAMDASYGSRNFQCGGIQERDACNAFSSFWTASNDPPTLHPNKADPRCFKINSYCRLFFNESESCTYKVCRFRHVPMEGDEKFCINMVERFTLNPACLLRAGALFINYYRDNPPGLFFSMPVFLSLLWALLKAGIVPDVLSVLSVSLAHKIVPTHEFLLALFTFVREKSFTSVVPHLLLLTYKMASEHLMLSLDCFDVVKNTPEFQQLIHSDASANLRVSITSSVPVSDSLNLAYVMVEMELCVKQADWCCLAKAFSSICTPHQHPSQLERISGYITVALLSETKDKMSVPFAAFAETICPNGVPDCLLMGFIGRIGVSLMLRYHKTQQWAKGRKVVEVLTQFRINYSMQKGLFENENGQSRCHLITLATEIFLLSGSLEGALQTLRENKWFVSCNMWPCEHPDLENRSRVLVHLAEKASQRDALEVLCNLPGIQEPYDQVDISRYTPMFNAHLKVCVDRLMLSVAADSVDLMLSRKIPVEGAVLQALLHKLGKQNLWLRARKIFSHSQTTGYYPAVSAPAGFMALTVSSRLGEVELALTFEMLITVNASVILPISEKTPATLSITLKRSQESESEYLSAGSRLLSAALIPQPKLEVHYTAVNFSQEQVFTLSVASAQRWLRSNHMWANDLWAS